MKYEPNPDAAVLTPKQKQVLDLIAATIEKNGGVPPSLAELATMLKVSKVTVHEYVCALRRKGVLAPGTGRGRARNLRLVDTPARRLARFVIEKYSSDKHAAELAMGVLAA